MPSRTLPTKYISFDRSDGNLSENHDNEHHIANSCGIVRPEVVEHCSLRWRMCLGNALSQMLGLADKGISISIRPTYF